MAPQRTVLIVEDDEAITESVRYHLERAGLRTLSASDGARGLRMFRAQRPDLVILDLMLPGIDGWRFTEEVRAEDARVPIVVCSARTSEYDRVNGLEIGADDYVTKPFSMRELVARVQAHLRRLDAERGGEPTVIEVGGLRIDPVQVQAFGEDVSADLTPREFEVLLALARSRDKPVPREQLYREVWGYEMAHGDRSVDVFVRKVRSKLDRVLPGVTVIRTHYGVGYRFAPENGGAEDAALSGMRGAPAPPEGGAEHRRD